MINHRPRGRRPGVTRPGSAAAGWPSAGSRSALLCAAGQSSDQLRGRQLPLSVERRHTEGQQFARVILVIGAEPDCVMGELQAKAAGQGLWRWSPSPPGAEPLLQPSPCCWSWSQPIPHLGFPAAPLPDCPSAARLSGDITPLKTPQQRERGQSNVSNSYCRLLKAGGLA